MTDFFAEAKRYVAWSDADVTRLAALEPVLAPHFVQFADHFYAVIRAHPTAMAVITGGPAQIERLKVTLVEWMASGLRGPHDDRFYERRSRIGRRHVAIGLPQGYMFTAMDVLRLDYHAALHAALRDPDELHAAIAAVDKLFDLELAIMLRHYQLVSEERLVERERTAQADRMIAMQTLTAGLAHEVRNPLNAARLQLELLERRLRRATDDERLLETTELIAHEIGRLSRLLDEFLAFARPHVIATDAHDLTGIVREVLDLERPGADARGIALVMDEATAPLTAHVDAGKVHQIVQNLVRNATEAAGQGGRVTVELATAPGGAQIRVSDTGPGIPDAVRARIYEPFFSTKPEGTGMGLAIVHSLVSAHGGTIEVAPGGGERGTTFVVTLPRR